MNAKFKKIITVSALAIASLVTSAGLVGATTFTPLTSQLSYGSTGFNVTNLQTFLASNRDIYSAGLVTGYYGSLTKAAVQQYQLSYGIQMLGNVGPATFASVNNTIAKGYGIDVYGPTIYSVSVQKTQNGATFNWATTEAAYGKVYYSTTPFVTAEAVGNFTAPTILGGLNVTTPYAQLAHSTTISNLQSNTLYYYIIQATDASGNVSVTGRSTFTTN